MGEKLRIARKEAGLTQKQLAVKLGLTFQAIQKWETGSARPRPERLKLIASALHKPLEFFTESSYLGHYAHEHQSDYRSTSKSETNDITELIKMARVVLSSGSVYAEALRENIKAFHQAVMDMPQKKDPLHPPRLNHG